MTRGHEMDDEESRPAEAPARYEAPAIAWEDPFDLGANLASACGKIASDELCSSDPAS